MNPTGVRNIPVENVFTTQSTPNVTSQEAPTNGTCFNFDNSAASIASQLIFALVIVVLNSIVVTVIYTGPKKTYRKPAFVFIGSLATTDMILAVTLLMYTALAAGNYQLPADTWVVLTATTSVCFNASVNFLLVVALDRLLFIGYNRRYRKIMTKRKVVGLIVLCWLVALVPVIPLLAAKTGSCAKYCLCQYNQRLVCANPVCSRVVKGLTKQFLFGLFFYFLVMLVSIGGIYFVLFSKVMRHANRVKDLTDGASTRGKSKRMQREFKLARTLGIVVATFFFCWSPLMLLYVVDYAAPGANIEESVALAIMMPAVLNSVCNPLIYAARIPRMRRYLCPCASRTDDTSTDGSGSRKARERMKSIPSIRTKSKSQRESIKRPIEREESAGTSQPSQGISHAESTLGELPSKSNKLSKTSSRIAQRLRSYIGKSSSASDTESSGKLTNGFSRVNCDVSVTPSAPNSGNETAEARNDNVTDSEV